MFVKNLNHSHTIKQNLTMSNLPFDIIFHHIIPKLDIYEKAACALMCKEMLHRTKHLIKPLIPKHVFLKKVIMMIDQVAKYPPYKIRYSLHYHWDIWHKSNDQFCIVIQKQGKNNMGMFMQNKTTYLKPQEIYEKVKEFCLDKLDDLIVKGDTEYKRKRVELL